MRVAVSCPAMMRRTDIRFYAILAVVVITVIIVVKYSRPHTHDFRALAHAKLQLSTANLQPVGCEKEDDSHLYEKTLSVVISTKAEEEAVITQTVNSILAHTNPQVLNEIIIATDTKVTEDKLVLLKKEFAEYHPLIKILNGQSDNRLKNKLVVGHVATGDVVMYVDDTVVVTANYLSPLLATLQGNAERIAVPSFDYLTDLTVSVEKIWSQMKWIFGWNLEIKAYELSFQELASKPEIAASPAMVFDTAAFAINKAYLTKLGSIKSGMDYSSSVEFSFATWLCGEGAYVSPCSRIAKIHADYAIPVPDVKERHMIAERYMSSKHLDVFHRVNKEHIEWSEDEKKAMTVDRSFQRKCPKSFTWYMDKIVKGEVFIPSKDALAYGYFNSASGKTCFRQAPSMVFLGSNDCKNRQHGKMVEYLQTGQLRLGTECIYGGDQSYMLTDPCDYDKEEMKWKTSKFHQFIDNKNRCISHSTDPYPEQKGRQVLMFTDCTNDTKSSSMRWQSWQSFVWL